MARIFITIIALFIMNQAQADIIYKCVKGEKVVFSQTTCPKEFSQLKIEFDLGITTETDSDKRENKIDPIKILLTDDSLSIEKQMRLLEAETYRLNQENSYFEILRTSELQKVRRQKFWQKKETSDPEYLAEIETINIYFDEIIASNKKIIILLDTRKSQIKMEVEDKAAQ
ncbi:DUF4124 domain-containing protein [Shewanella sp. D64]|uniref:DUF4124 domain-containing protein n=1 Tax=unclassified Shewanella TaxID=196818 RepID=UPI0022BA62C0|nr:MULTISPECIES: DUF4124 domain-containing protein [unclassified Shewanella]MEC4724436.1 DUF4124 domain-containing protein [Shewanella sp. D64]MEC4736787.1 DUF4124 domain-containing protein [Shewanella sp. E94]WBJ98266.1 DUF4124 domain-containing protein [Shewanella sp. MTB7]